MSMTCETVLPLCGFLPTNLWVGKLFLGGFVGESFYVMFVGKFCRYLEIKDIEEEEEDEEIKLI